MPNQQYLLQKHSLLLTASNVTVCGRVNSGGICMLLRLGLGMAWGCWFCTDIKARWRYYCTMFVSIYCGQGFQTQTHHTINVISSISQMLYGAGELGVWSVAHFERVGSTKNARRIMQWLANDSYHRVRFGDTISMTQFVTSLRGVRQIAKTLRRHSDISLKLSK